jgi:predicted amidophosphoribosyltransferase
MDAMGRRASVASAFAVSYPRLVAGEKILLVDDVFTTGATVSACAQVLLSAGAESVLVLTVARPVRY